MISRVMVVVACLCGVGVSEASDAADAKRPNILVILADDLGFSDLGCYGGEIDTPNLDKLAAGGLRYTQGYNTARCWPTRAALLTGYYPQAIGRDSLPGDRWKMEWRRPAWAPLLPKRLAPAGYRSYHSGKWHIDGDPRREGFDRSLDITGEGQSNFFDPAGVKEDGKLVEAGDDFYVTTAIGDHAVNCLAEHAREHEEKPFFHYVAFTAPHFPLHAPPEVIAKYRDRYMAGWDAVRAARAKRLATEEIVTTAVSEVERDLGPPYHFPDALKQLGPDEVNHPEPWGSLNESQHEFQATKMAIHAAMVDVMDREIGRILQQLAAMGALENTLILFASDNGASAEMMIRGEGHDPAAALGSRKSYLCLGPGWSTCANTPFRRHKTWVHEGGIATPWIVHWPAGVSDAGKLRTQPVHVIDLVPTVLDLAGVPAQEGQAAPPMQGKSFAASLRDAKASPAHESLWWCHEGNRAVRVGDWKLVAAKGDPWELYDLAKDRCETANLAASQPERVAVLEKEWNRIADECRGRAPSPRPKKPRPLSGRRPNIIYVMTDDQGYGDIAAHGNPILDTPNLDRLRDQSVRLTEYHVSPTCSPTRAALMTGRHEFRSGITHTIHERERLALTAVTLPQLLRSAGYATGIFGKWHLGDEDAYQPRKRGFDRTFIHGAGGIGQTYPGSCGDAPGNTYFDPVIRSDGAFVRTEGYCTDVFFDAAIEWMNVVRGETKPFFCYVATNAPHSPYDCPPGSDKKYMERLANVVADPKERVAIAKFYGMIENIDTNVGRLLAKLDAWGIADDTLLVFTTDNGTAQGAAVFNAGMRGHKGSPYRGGTRVPSFWRWPGTLPGTVDVAAVTAHIDVFPTLCDVAGVELPSEVSSKIEGRSLMPLLVDPEAAWPDRMLVTHVGRWPQGKVADGKYANCRVREGRWSLVQSKHRPKHDRAAWELYDIEADPGEKRDVAIHHPDVVARLAKGYDAWWESVQSDLVNEDAVGPSENPFKTAFWNQFGREATARPGEVLETVVNRKPEEVRP
jgi:arylsulfatase